MAVDPRDPRTVYVAATGHLYTENPERGVYKTADGGETWTRVLFADERTGTIDLVQDPSQPDVLYAATWERARTAANFLESGPGTGIWKSTDAGATWARLGGGLPTGATVGRIGLALAASRPATLYAVIDNQARRPESEPFDEEAPPGELTPRRLRGMSGSAIARLDDAVVARFLKAYELPKKLQPARLKADVLLPGVGAWAACRTTGMREDPKARHLLYVGTDSGAFVSLDGGKGWAALTGGLPRVAVHDLLVHPREGDLVLAIHGRSVPCAAPASATCLPASTPSRSPRRGSWTRRP